MVMQAKLMNRKNAGLTLVELMVALILSLLVVMAAYASLTVARQGFGTVSGVSQLRDNARFATAILSQLVMQAGYKNDYNATYMQAYANTTGFNLGSSAKIDKFIEGLSQATLASDGQVINNSDVLYLRYMAAPVNETEDSFDQAMINCAGVAPSGQSALIESRLFVALSNGEPTLMCQYPKSDTSNENVTEPLIEGVEVFQVLYGINDAVDGQSNTIHENEANFQYKRAQDIASDAEWRKVRSLRIGMVLRSADGLASERESQDYWPLGESGATNSPNKFTSPVDARLRQTVTFTVQLRNNVNPPNLQAVL